MRNPNQINNARRRETDAQGKRRVDGEAGHRQCAKHKHRPSPPTRKKIKTLKRST